MNIKMKMKMKMKMMIRTWDDNATSLFPVMSRSPWSSCPALDAAITFRDKASNTTSPESSPAPVGTFPLNAACRADGREGVGVGVGVNIGVAASLVLFVATDDEIPRSGLTTAPEATAAAARKRCTARYCT